MHNSGLIVTTVFLLSLSIFASEERNCSLGERLVDLARRYDCYFTVEMASRKQEGSNSFICTALPSVQPTAGSTLNTELTAITEHFPRFTFQRDEDNARIIHIYDNAIDTAVSYPLSKRLPADFEFSGSPAALVGQLRTVYPEIVPNKLILGVSESDKVTLLKINTKHECTVRSVLGNFVPLMDYCRIIWVSTVDLEDACKVRIWFAGKRNVRSFDGLSAPHISLEFSNGEKAYATAISYRDNVVSEARAFIDNTKDDLQMRFAMRLLGDLRATEAIPTLIAHLNWKYCDSNLIEDACPAVYSLRLIGRDAIEPLIKDLLSRQQLPPEYSSVAAYVMQSILGKDDAKRFISEKIRAATGQGTARLEALLKEIECFAAKPDTAPPGQEARMTQ